MKRDSTVAWPPNSPQQRQPDAAVRTQTSLDAAPENNPKKKNTQISCFFKSFGGLKRIELGHATTCDSNLHLNPDRANAVSL